jgi:penicillin-binding protein 2
MSVIRNIEFDLQRFRSRVVVVSGFILLAFLLLSLRLFYLQIIRYEDLNEQAENNRTAIVPIVPNRGVIMDRNGIVLATNYSAYTLEITPSKLVAPLEEVIEQLAGVIDIQSRDKRRFKKLMTESKNFESVPIRTRLSDEEVAAAAVSPVASTATAQAVKH